MIRTKLIVVALLIILGSVLVALLVSNFYRARQTQGPQDASASSTNPVLSSFTNDRYGYSVTVPYGYRLANEIIAASNSNESRNTADFVVVTDLPPAQEQLVAAQIRKLDPQNRLVSAQAVLTGNDFTVSPVNVDLGWDFAKHFAALTVPGTNIATVQDLASDTLDDGQEAVSYSLAIIDNPSIRLETVFISTGSTGREQALATTSVQGFLIQALDDASFSEPAFASFYRSFDLSR